MFQEISYKRQFSNIYSKSLYVFKMSFGKNLKYILKKDVSSGLLLIANNNNLIVVRY